MLKVRKMMMREAVMGKEKNNANRCFMEGMIRKLDGEGNERCFLLSFSSEEPYERWWGVEILSHTEGAMDLTRLNTIGCVLYNHNRDKAIGKIRKAWVENGRGQAEIEFDTDAESEIIFQKVLSGTLKGVSVGYMVKTWEDVAANQKSACGRFTGPCSIAIKWIPYEISIVSVPADPTVGVGRSEEVQKGVSSFYFNEKQLQINQNILISGGSNHES